MGMRVPSPAKGNGRAEVRQKHADLPSLLRLQALGPCYAGEECDVVLQRLNGVYNRLHYITQTC